MKSMVLRAICDLAENQTPLELTELPDPIPADKELLLKVLACGVCHTELDEIEGRTPPPNLPIVLGHQVVGRVEVLGDGVWSCCVHCLIFLRSLCGSICSSALR